MLKGRFRLWSVSQKPSSFKSWNERCTFQVHQKTHVGYWSWNKQTQTNQTNKQTHTENSLLRTMLRRKSNQVSGQITIFPKNQNCSGICRGIPLLFTTIWGDLGRVWFFLKIANSAAALRQIACHPRLPNEEVGEATLDGKQMVNPFWNKLVPFWHWLVMFGHTLFVGPKQFT